MPRVRRRYPHGCPLGSPNTTFGHQPARTFAELIRLLAYPASHQTSGSLTAMVMTMASVSLLQHHNRRLCGLDAVTPIAMATSPACRTFFGAVALQIVCRAMTSK